MTPRRLRLHGFRTFHDLTLDLPAGCVGVIGDNGAGKSSLVIAIELALFGPQSRSLEPFLTTGEDDLLIELELDHAGERYRIRRNYSAKGRGKSVLDFERDVDFRGGDHPAGCESLTAETAAATQEKIEKTLGLTRETWKASAYLAQGESDTFTSAAPKDRKRILTDALGLHIWDELAALNHTVIVERKQRDTEITARLGVLQEQADRALEAEIATKCATLELQGCDEDLALAAETVLQNEERHAHAQQAATRYETATRAAETAKALLAAHDQLGQAAEEARPLVGAVLTEIVALEPRVKELERLQADRVRLEAEQHIVCLLADGGWKYLSSNLWTTEWENQPEDIDSKTWW